jgi:outer membrane protein TolC
MKKIFVLLCMIMLTGMLFAQTLNLEQVRLLALANSRSLAKYELSIRSSILDERNQLYNMLPSISAGYSASASYLQDWNFVNPIDTLRAGATLSISQVIFQGGKSFIQKAISSIATESIRKDALAEYFNVLDSADNAYYAVLEAGAALEAEEVSLEAAILSLAIAEIRNSNGIINQNDYLKAQADKEARENSLNQTRRNLTLNIAKLRNLIGITGAVEIEQIDFNSYEKLLSRLSLITDEEADELYDVFWRLLTVSNPSLEKAALSSQRAEKNLTLAWRDLSPTISATVSTGLNYSTANGFSTTSQGSVSITGSIPLDFWVISNKIEKSKIARDSAAFDYVNTEISLGYDLQNALLNAFAQAGSVLSSRRTLQYAETNFEYTMERYRLSQSSVSNLSEATSLFLTSRNNYTKATYGFLQSLSKLRSLCAIEDEEKLFSILLGN